MFPARDILSRLEKFKENVSASFQEVEDLDGACRSLLQRYLNIDETPEASSIIRIQAVIDYMYEKVNIGNWKEVKLFIRKTITIASYLKLLLQISCINELTDDIIKESLKIIDFGILFGCPLYKEPRLLQNCASILTSAYRQITNSNDTSDLKFESTTSIITTDNTNESNYSTTVLKSIDCPSMEYFLNNHILAGQPVVLNNCMNHWPAIKKWKDDDYLIKLAGLRTVSIELGSKYTDTDWTQKLMTIEEFIKQYIHGTHGPTGYLAQYQLFDQIPELKNDIIEPEYCCFSDTNEPVDVMAWYGPKGTVSPLHHDPKRNLLAQVVGEKQIFLFAPTDSEYLYPHDHELLNNTAQVDPRQPDLEKYPKYKNAKGYFCVLRPGQMLYIPPKWWHFVESLSISFSVSFWWE